MKDLVIFDEWDLQVNDVETIEMFLNKNKNWFIEEFNNLLKIERNNLEIFVRKQFHKLFKELDKTEKFIYQNNIKEAKQSIEELNWREVEINIQKIDDELKVFYSFDCISCFDYLDEMDIEADYLRELELPFFRKNFLNEMNLNIEENELVRVQFKD